MSLQSQFSQSESTHAALGVKATFQLASVRAGDHEVHVTWNDGHESIYNNLWLMDACRCKKCFQDDTLSVNIGNDPMSMPLEQKLILPPSTRQVNLSWSGMTRGVPMRVFLMRLGCVCIVSLKWEKA